MTNGQEDMTTCLPCRWSRMPKKKIMLLYSKKTLVGENFGGFGTVRKLAEKTLAADHTNNGSLFELTTFGG